MKILGFYHIFAVNDYRDIVEDQLRELKECGLLTKTDELTISIIGDDYNIGISKNIIDENLKFTNKNIITTNINHYESLILNEIYKKSLNNNFYCYYFHTKGVSINENNASFYHNLDFTTVKKTSKSWRKAMEFFIFKNHKACISELDNGYDAVGMNLYQEPKLHFSGNFWWSKSDHIKKLQPIKDCNNRYYCEFWISSSNNGVFKSLSQNKSGYSQIDNEYQEIFKKEQNENIK